MFFTCFTDSSFRLSVYPSAFASFFLFYPVATLCPGARFERARQWKGYGQGGVPGDPLGRDLRVRLVPHGLSCLQLHRCRFGEGSGEILDLGALRSSLYAEHFPLIETIGHIVSAVGYSWWGLICKLSVYNELVDLLCRLYTSISSAHNLSS